MLNARAILPLFFCLVLAAPVAARTFSAGAPVPRLQDISLKPDATSPDAVLSDEEILENLWSDKAFEVRRSFTHLDKRLKTLLENKKPVRQYVDRAVELLAAASATTRNAAQGFLKKNTQLLLTRELITPEKIAKESKAAYSSKDALERLVSLLDLFLPSDPDLKMMEIEYVFQILEALAGDNPQLAEIARRLLKQSGRDFIQKDLWTSAHTKDFLLKFREAPAANKILFLQILEANLEAWVSGQFLTKFDFIQSLNQLRSADPDLEAEFIRFLTDKNNIAILSKLDLFDRAWVDTLLTDALGDDPEPRRNATNLLSYLIPAFAQNKTFTGADFRRLWARISGDFSAYDEPFAIVDRNIGPLIRAGWFSRRDWETLLEKSHAWAPPARRQILSFLNTHYERLENAGWISATPLLPLIFDNFKDKASLTLALTLLSDHPDLVQDKHIFDKTSLIHFLKLLKHPNEEIFGLAVHIVNNGFDTWAADHSLDSDIVRRLLAFDASQPRTARILNATLSHFDHTTAFFDREAVLHIAELSRSPLPKVVDQARDFFAKNFPLLVRLDWVDRKLRTELRKSGLWEELRLQLAYRTSKKHR